MDRPAFATAKWAESEPASRLVSARARLRVVLFCVRALHKVRRRDTGK